MSDYSRRYYKKNKEKLLKQHENWRNKNPVRTKELLRRAHLKRIYGITLEQYAEMLQEQEYCCAVCGKHESTFKNSLAVDHDHVTKAIRGLLCFPCNSGLIGRNRDPVLFEKAAEYLRREQKPWIVPKKPKRKKKRKRKK